MNIQDFFMQTQRMYGVGPYRIKYETDAQGRLKYVGFAPRGTSTSENVWFIEILTYPNTETYQPSDEQTAPYPCIWDNRASLSYS